MNNLNSRSPSFRPNSYDIVSFTPPTDEVAERAVHLQEMSCRDLPVAFLVKDDGIYELRPTEDGDTCVHLCSPLFVRGLCSRPDGSGWGRVVEIIDPRGQLHQHVIDEAHFAGGPRAVLRPLLDLGLVLGRVDKADRSVVELLRAWRPAVQFTRTQSCGWVDDGFQTFVAANGSVIGKLQLIVPPERPGPVAAAVQTTGTVESWRTHIGALCVGNPLMVLAVSHAFTGPLLRPLGMEGGGFHLRGDSAKGKTTLMKTAASVWGSPSFVQSWRATDNGLEGLATACNDSLLLLDELAEVCPSKLGEIIYMLGNGKGKARARQDGSVKPGAEWRLQVISSGEISAEAHMESAGKPIRAGQEVRLIDIAADTRSHGAFDCLHGIASGSLFAQHLSEMTRVHHGAPGPAFVEKLIEFPGLLGRASRMLNKFCEKSLEQVDIVPDGKIQRVLRRFMIAAVAGEIATTLGLTGWPKGTALTAAQDAFLRWLQDRETATRSEIADAISKTRAYLDANRHHFVPVGPVSSPGHPGWMDERSFFIRSEAWSAIHSNSLEAARLHKAAGLLLSNNGTGLQFKMCRDVPGRPLVYAIRAEVLSWTATG